MLLVRLMPPVHSRLASLHSIHDAVRGRMRIVAAVFCAAACLCGGGASARAQSTLLEFIDETPTVETELTSETEPPATLLESMSTKGTAVEQVLPPSHDIPMGEPPLGFESGPYGSGIEDDPSLMPSSMPISWISGPYLRYGVDFVIGDGVLEGGQKVSWGINGGYRQPLSLGLAPPNMFFDLGGGFSSAVGMTERFYDAVETTNAGQTVQRPDAYHVRLTEVRRASVQAALGWYWGDVVDHREFDPQLRFATRFGGRVGSVRGNFLQALTFDLPANSSLTTIDYRNTDTFGGLLVGTEAILLKRSFGNCNVLWTADLEFSNDGIEFGGFNSGNLGMASIMTGIMLSR